MKAVQLKMARSAVGWGVRVWTEILLDKYQWLGFGNSSGVNLCLHCPPPAIGVQNSGSQQDRAADQGAGGGNLTQKGPGPDGGQQNPDQGNQGGLDGGDSAAADGTKDQPPLPA